MSSGVSNKLASMRAVWLGLLIASVALLSIATFDDRGPETSEERIQRLSDSFACPECDGQAVSESNAAVAANIRTFIRDRVTEGATDTEIRDELIRSYSSDVLLNPPSEGISALVWILPVVVAVFGVAGLVVSIRRDGEGSRTASAADVALVAEARTDSTSTDSDASRPPASESDSSA